MKKHCEFCGVLIEGMKRITKKYCSDNCKQLAFYARQGINWGNPAHKELHNVKPDFTLNGKPEEMPEISEENNVQPKEQPQKAEPVAVKPVVETRDNVKPAPYSYVRSPLVEAIEYYRNQNNAENMFSAPEYSWTQSDIPYVYWVTLRFRCLLDNIIRLSSFKTVDRNAPLAISNAFIDLTDSLYFKGIPHNYPFISLIVQLRDKFSDMAKHLRGDEITLRLSLNRKAELMAARFVIGNFVPKMGFGQLKFGDGIKEEVAKEFQQRHEE